jgi:hypothetical protein
VSADGTSGITTSTQLTLTFDVPVTGLTLNEITVSGAAGKSGASLTGNGTIWYVPITVTSQGTASVTVNHTGINTTAHTVSVYQDLLSHGISNISYTAVSGDSWTVQGDGGYKSPTITHNETSKLRVDFTSTGTNAVLTIQLDVSSESGYDYAFVGNLDDDSATRTSNYYARISGANSQIVTITVPSAGSHYVEIGYAKDGSVSDGSDCAWFKIE